MNTPSKKEKNKVAVGEPLFYKRRLVVENLQLATSLEVIQNIQLFNSTLAFGVIRVSEIRSGPEN